VKQRNVADSWNKLNIQANFNFDSGQAHIYKLKDESCSDVYPVGPNLHIWIQIEGPNLHICIQIEGPNSSDGVYCT
jgi:hypothetical protein